MRNIVYMNDLEMAIIIGGIIMHIAITILGTWWFFNRVKKFIDKNRDKFYL